MTVKFHSNVRQSIIIGKIVKSTNNIKIIHPVSKNNEYIAAKYNSKSRKLTVLYPKENDSHHKFLYEKVKMDKNINSTDNLTQVGTKNNMYNTTQNNNVINDFLKST